MKKLFLLICLLLSINCFSQDQKNYTKYSWTEFFSTINTSQDSIVTLSNIIIEFDEDKDKDLQQFKVSQLDFINQKKIKIKDSIFITKKLVLKNIFHRMTGTKDYSIMPNGIIFNKDVSLVNTSLGLWSNSIFQGSLSIQFDDAYIEELQKVKVFLKTNWAGDLSTNMFGYSTFHGITFWNRISNKNDLQFGFLNCDFYGSNRKDSYSFKYENQDNFWITKCTFYNCHRLSIQPGLGNTLDLNKNNFTNTRVLGLDLDEMTINAINISENVFNGTVLLKINKLNESDFISWPQFSGNIIDQNRLVDYFIFSLEERSKSEEDSFDYYDFTSDENIAYYKRKVRIENENIYHAEKKIRSSFYNYYKQNLNTDFSNAVYIEIKDLETERLEYLYHLKPSFKTFFTWKTNEFLKIFSAYGTEPARAIIFSMYVILIFALVYLFFPNSWDSHGKNRIIDRYNFFFKYMKQKAGIHEVYLEEQKGELMSYEQFKENITNSNQKVPRFFTATALPLYKWAISGTQFSASILKRIDIMKGTWSDLPKSKRIWKSILLISAFLVAIVYDIIIKTLNAIMLSINTFTTLGFGEIPIKGLPRYLAIIQGFIGWFMLTIFSVSLISQLLN